MRRWLISSALLLAACGPASHDPMALSKDPISVRGWIDDVAGSPHAPFQTKETEADRKLHLFQSASVWIDGAPYVSGGLQENGAFLLLDVPPGNVTIRFAAPGAATAQLVLQNVPGNSDVYVPHVILKEGGVTLADPAALRIRLAADTRTQHPSGHTATVAGTSVAVMETPMSQMTDRLDFPVPPGGAVAPLATVR